MLQAVGRLGPGLPGCQGKVLIASTWVLRKGGFSPWRGDWASPLGEAPATLPSPLATHRHELPACLLTVPESGSEVTRGIFLDRAALIAPDSPPAQGLKAAWWEFFWQKSIICPRKTDSAQLNCS